MDLDLTPKKYKPKTVTSKRRRKSRLMRNWHNPFQLAIFAVAVIAFIGTAAYERVRDRQSYNELFSSASSAAEEAAVLNREAHEAYDELQSATANVVLKQKTPQETEVEHRLDKLVEAIDACFQTVNEGYKVMPPRYKSSLTVRQWYIEFTQQCIDAALVRNDVEQARLWFNASALNSDLAEVRSRIEGRGSLEINVAAMIEQVVVLPLKSDGPRLVPCDPLRKSDAFPLVIPELDMGSYLLWATRTNGTFSIFPLYIAHGEQKHCELTVPASIPEGMVYVPAGPFFCGGDESPIYRRHSRSLAAFFIKQKEVTIGEYLEFWKSLNDEKLKNACMSRVCFDEEQDPVPAWDEEGRLLDERLQLDFPVVGLTHEAVATYCEWLGSRMDRKVRLPSAFEWEKAARGVDGRTYPWGYGFEPDADLAHCLANPKGKDRYPLWAPPGSFRRDVSVYSVYDMAGNVREMTSTPIPGHDGVFQIKGGSMTTPSAYLACGYVSGSEEGPSDLGFRYVMELKGDQ